MRVLSVTELQSGMANYITMGEGIEKVVPKVEKQPVTAMLYASDRTETQTTSLKRVSQKKTDKKMREVKCMFCSDSHYGSVWPVVSMLSARKAALKDRCEKCFGRHGTDKCQRTVICALCKAVNYHHRVLILTLYIKDRMITTEPNTIRKQLPHRLKSLPQFQLNRITQRTQ